MADSYFILSEARENGGRYVAGPATGGPWDERLQHGGPPAALAVTTAEQVVRDETGRSDLVALRLAAEFIGPVPVDEVETRGHVVRAARSAALVEVAVSAAGRPCLQARVWFVRTSDTTSVAGPLDAVVEIPDVPEGLDVSFPFGSSVEWRFVKNQMGRPGPAAAWARPRLPLIPGVELRGLARVTLIADSANGLAAELDWTVWSFLNVDLDIHLARPVAGEWVLMDAATQFGPTGTGLVRATLSDVRGLLGSGLQTLVVAPLAQPQ